MVFLKYLNRSTYRPIYYHRNDNLTPGVAVTCNMPWKCLNVRHELRGPCRCYGAADASTECNGLAGDFAMEGPKDQLFGLVGIKNVEA